MAPPTRVRDLLIARLGVPTTPRQNLVSAGAWPTVTPLVKQDGSRIGFLVVNLGGFDAFLAPDIAGIMAATTLGVRIAPNGGAMTVDWQEDGEVVGWGWVCATVGGTSGLFILETIIDQGRHVP